MTNPCISILMPTYNDSNYISHAIKSVLSQSYNQWQLIIINDGSTDNSKEVINQFLSDKRILYIEKQENEGQVNAIKTGSQYIIGDYVTILHSDDLFSDNTSLQYLVDCIYQNNYDGLYSDFRIIDKDGYYKGILSSLNFFNKSVLIMLFLSLGSNPIPDIFFVKKNIFFQNVFKNYLTWNIPYWIVENKILNILKLKKVNPWYSYRKYNENYILSEVGKFEVTNGCVRTILLLCKFFHPAPKFINDKISWTIKKIFNIPVFFAFMRPYSGDKYSLVKGIYESYYNGNISKNPYMSSLLQFYLNKPSNRKIFFPDKLINECNKWYLGSDAKMFYKDLMAEQLDNYYIKIFEECCSGFSIVEVESKDAFEKVKTSLKFLNIDAEVILL